MHDLYLAKEIFDLIIRYAHRNKFKKVKTVEIEIGRFQEEAHPEEVTPENLKFNLEALAKGSIVEHAKINIKKVIGQGYKLVAISGQ